MRIDLASAPSAAGHPNEDFACVATGEGGAAVVLDGVSPSPYSDSGCHHGTPWFVARLGGDLAHLAVANRDEDLRRCLAEAVTRTAAAHGSTCDLRRVRSPQATLAAVRWDAEVVEYLVLADSAVLIERVGGVVEPVLDVRLDEVRARCDVRASKARLDGLPPGSPAWHRAMQEHQEFADRFRNRHGGFFTVAGEPGVAALAVHGTLLRSEVTRVALVTDGVSRWCDVFHQGGWRDLLELLEQGVAGAIDRVRELELADPACTRFPRTKTCDDASAIHLEL